MFFVVFVFAIVMILLIAALWTSSRQIPPADTRPCPSCGALHPEFASFCRQCGGRLRSD